MHKRDRTDLTIDIGQGLLIVMGIWATIWVIWAVS